MSQPDTSHIRVLSYADYKAMSVQAIQSLLRDYHIAITGFPTQNIVEADHVDFDETGLQLLTNLEAPIEFQGKLSQSFSLHNINSHLVTFMFRPINPSR